MAVNKDVHWAKMSTFHSGNKGQRGDLLKIKEPEKGVGLQEGHLGLCSTLDISMINILKPLLRETVVF